MKRCTKCVLPENYPAITFNKDGVCNYCTNHREQRYLGGEALKETIESILEAKDAKSNGYSCVLGLSGGRDSSYLLYYLVKVLGLRVLSYCVDNGFMPEQTKLNIRNMVDVLGVELVVEETDALKKCVKHHMRSWMHRPSPGMTGLLCTGCRLAIAVGLNRFARENEIPIFIQGDTPLEGFSYKRRILSTDPTSRKSSLFMLGYLSQIAANPRWIMNPTCLITQIREYYHHFYKKKNRQQGPIRISPFHSYIKWEESEIVSRIESEFGWQKNPEVEFTWRGDCDIALLKLYLYKATLGFNDKDEGLSNLIRDGQLSREEALERLRQEEVPEEVIREILGRLELDFSDLQRVLRHKAVR